MHHHIFSSPPPPLLGISARRIFWGVVIVLFTLLAAAALWILLSTAAAAAATPPESTLSTPSLERQLFFEDSMAGFTAVVETLTAYHTILWEQYCLGTITQDEWMGACSLANQVVAAGEAVLNAAYTYIGAPGATADPSTSGLAEEMSYLTILFAAYLDYVNTLSIGKEIVPWQIRK